MARKKISSSNLVLFAGPSPATGAHPSSSIKELVGVQSFNYEITTAKEDVLVFGKRAAEKREDINPPKINFEASYLLGDFRNEKSFGFVVDGSIGAFSNLIDGTKDERNYFVMVSADGNDAIGSTPATTPCYGFGNGTINSYNFTAAVGDYPTVTVGFDALDAEYYINSDTQRLPSINVVTGAIPAQTFALPTGVGNTGRNVLLRPRDITVDLSGVSGLFYDLTNACVQSIDIGVDLGREDQECIGAQYRRDSVISDVIPLTFSVEFLAKDISAGRLSEFNCQTGLYGANITIRNPSCTGGGSVAVNYQLRGLSFENQSHDISVGGEASTVTVNFQGTIGGANDTTKGLFMSGIFA